MSPAALRRTTVDVTLVIWYVISELSQSLESGQAAVEVTSATEVCGAVVTVLCQRF